MSGQPTRAVEAEEAPIRGGIVPLAWRHWAQFVRRPKAPARAALALADGIKSVLKLYTLDLAIMAVLFTALGAAVALGFQMPEHLLGEMTLTPLLIAAIVIGAPVGEEILFRGWLSGRLGHVLGTLAAVPALFAIVTWIAPRPAGAPEPSAWLVGAVICGFAVMSLGFIYLLRKRYAPQWYRRHFAWFYWLSAVSFAAIHVTNFASVELSLLAMVLPQFALALLLGYLRVTRGLWSSVLLHMLHNATFMALVLGGSSAA